MNPYDANGGTGQAIGQPASPFVGPAPRRGKASGTDKAT